MKRHLIVLAFLLPAGYLAACTLLEAESAGPASSPSVHIETDQPAYIVDEALSIDLSITNRSDQPVYFDLCGAVFLEELENGQPVNTWRLRYLRCYASTPLAAGDQGHFRVTYEMLNTYVQGARFDASVSYRLKVFEFFTDRQPIDALANPYSNAFTLSR